MVVGHRLVVKLKQGNRIAGCNIHHSPPYVSLCGAYRQIVVAFSPCTMNDDTAIPLFDD